MMITEISDELLEKCTRLWDVCNTTDDELESYRSQTDNFSLVRQYPKDNWDRDKILAYHMGDCFYNRSNGRLNNGVIGWSLSFKNKLQFLGEIYNEDDYNLPTDLLGMSDLLKLTRSYLVCTTVDEMRWVYIQEQYSFWDNLTEDQLYTI